MWDSVTLGEAHDFACGTGYGAPFQGGSRPPISWPFGGQSGRHWGALKGPLIRWSTLPSPLIRWSTLPSPLIRWSTLPSPLIRWSTLPSPLIRWSTLPSPLIRWSTLPSPLIRWSTLPSPLIRWSTLPSPHGRAIQTPPPSVVVRRSCIRVPFRGGLPRRSARRNIPQSARLGPWRCDPRLPMGPQSRSRPERPVPGRQRSGGGAEGHTAGPGSAAR